MNTSQLIREAVSLPIEERALVADSVLRSINPSEASIDEHWAEEAENRLAELRAGLVEAVPGEQVFNKIWQRFAL